MIEHELARAVLLERFIEATSLEARFRKEWQALRADTARTRDIGADDHPVDLFLKGEGIATRDEELERAA